MATPNPMTGKNGELFDRLFATFRAFEESDREGFEKACFVLIVDAGFPFLLRQGDIDESVKLRHQTLDQFVGILLPQLQRGRETGFGEVFLTVGARDTVTGWFRHERSSIETSNVARAATRAQLEKDLDDPAKLEEKRQRLQAAKPQESITIERVRQGTRDLLDLFPSVDFDVSPYRAREQAWGEAVEAHLSDQLIEKWRRTRHMPYPW